MAGDWIKLHRKVLDSFVNSDAGLMHLWINLLIRANWKPSWFVKQRIGVGQVAFSCGNFADDLKVSRRTLIRRLKELEDGGQISVKANNRFTVVTILKWKSYQDCCDTRDTTEVTTDGTAADTTDAHQTPIKRPSDDTHPKKGRREEGKKYLFTSEDRELAEWMFGLVRLLNPTAKEPPWDRWSDDIRKLRDLDKRPHEQVRTLFMWANGNQFWKSIILSPAKLREKWDGLETQRLNGHRNGTHATHLSAQQYKPGSAICNEL